MSETVLITGAGIGIGRAAAKAFGAAGHHVVVTDVLDAEGQSCVAEIVAAGGSAEFHRLDVRSTADADALVARIEAERGGIDVIVANAGIAHKVPLPALTDDKWDHTLDIDLKGIFRVVRPALAGMKARKKGAIVALSSIMGVAYGWDEHVHYSAAKAGVVGLVRGLAVELARDGIRAVSHTLLKRTGEPEDIADVVLFLASNGARYMTGQVVVVDGGLLVGRY